MIATIIVYSILVGFVILSVYILTGIVRILYDHFIEFHIEEVRRKTRDDYDRNFKERGEG